MADYAIGDVQGCFDELMQLLDMIAFDRARDRLLFVGDLVNRGSRSLEVLRFVKALDDAACVVLGNHDLHLVMVAEGCAQASPEDTLDAVLEAPDRGELLAWLRRQPLCRAEDGFALVHAGLLPQWSVPQAQSLSDEVRAALNTPDYRDFLANMRGNEPALWHDELNGWPRLRMIVNAMTRMRFCTPEGRLELRSKGGPSQAPAGFMPWFAVPTRISADHVVICGHWSALGLKSEANLLALDSGCVWGGQLTAVRLQDRRLFQVGCGTPAAAASR